MGILGLQSDGNEMCANLMVCLDLQGEDQEIISYPIFLDDLKIDSGEAFRVQGSGFRLYNGMSLSV